MEKWREKGEKGLFQNGEEGRGKKKEGKGLSIDAGLFPVPFPTNQKLHAEFEE